MNLHKISLNGFIASLNNNVTVEDDEVVEEIDTEDIATSEPPNDQLLIYSKISPNK